MPRSLDQFRWISLVVICLSANLAFAGVIESSGHLAARSEGAPWRLLHLMDELPQQAELRTSSAGTVSVEVDGARLVELAREGTGR